MSEISKYRHLLIKYCYYPNGQPAPGADLGSGGDPLAPWGWNVELGPSDYAHYNASQNPRGPIQLFGNAFSKFVEANSLFWVSSSHLLEDRPQSQWPEIFKLWSNALMPGGHLIILVPEKVRWAEALRRGQSPNCSHSSPEPSLGDVSRVAKQIGLEVVEERLTDLDKNDYTILGVFKKP